MAHRRLPHFETWHRHLRLDCPYLVRVTQDAPGTHNRNAMPWSRLYAVPSDCGSNLGSVTDVSARETVAITPGRILLLPGNRLYRFDFEPTMRMVAWHFRLEWAPGCDAFAGDQRLTWTDAHPDIANRAWVASAHDDSIGTVMRLFSLAIEGASLFLDHDWQWADAQVAARRRLAPLFETLRDHPAPRLSTADAARILSVTREHATRLVRALTGMTLSELCDRSATDHACHRLLHGDNSSTIADDLGFSSAFAFSRFFLRRTGSRPSHFARLP